MKRIARGGFHAVRFYSPSGIALIATPHVSVSGVRRASCLGMPGEHAARQGDGRVRVRQRAERSGPDPAEHETDALATRET